MGEQGNHRWAPGRQWSAIRRRRLLPWALAYVAAAFAVLQGIDLVSSHRAWPPWVMQSALLVAAWGLPIALVLAWHHGETGLQRVTRGEVGALSVLALLACVNLHRGVEIDPRVATDAAARPVIAVLPLDNLGAADDDGLVDGLHDELISRLSTLPGVDVISRASTLAYRDRRDLAPQIARALGASHLLEGSAHRVGDRVRLRLQFSDARLDRQQFTRTLERQLVDVFEAQALIATEIAEELRLALAPGTVAELSRRPTASADAYDAYLAARLALGDGDFERAAERLDVALRIDPGFIDALALSAWAQSRLAIRGLNVDTRGNAASARARLEQLAALAPEHPMTALASSVVAYWLDQNLAAGYALATRVLASRPSETTALQLLVWICRRLGRDDEADRHLARWQALSPGSAEFARNAYLIAVHAHDYPRARRVARQVDAHPGARALLGEEADLDFLERGTPGPSSPLPPDASARRVVEYQIAAARGQGDIDALVGLLPQIPETYSPSRFRALAPRSLYLALLRRLGASAEVDRESLAAASAILDADLRLRPSDPLPLAWRGWVHALAGDTRSAIDALARAHALAGAQEDLMLRATVAEQLAPGYALAGAMPEALAMLEECLRLFGGCHPGEVRADPIWAPLRVDQRYLAVLAGQGAPIEFGAARTQ